jgi:hypothetical protein
MFNINSNNENKKRIDNSNYLPFYMQWLDSSYQQTCLPDSSWQRVNFIIIFFF